MSGQQGERRSVFKVDVHSEEHATADEALETCPIEIARLRERGSVKKADELEGKLDTLRDLTTKERS